MSGGCFTLYQPHCHFHSKSKFGRIQSQMFGFLSDCICEMKGVTESGQQGIKPEIIFVVL